MGLRKLAIKLLLLVSMSVSAGAGLLVLAGPASAASLPYIHNEFCSTSRWGATIPVSYEKVCTGYYTVEASNYSFTQSELGYCPRYGINVGITLVYGDYENQGWNLWSIHVYT